MLKTISRWASGRRTKWYVVGFWVLLLAISTLPGQLTEQHCSGDPGTGARQQRLVGHLYALLAPRFGLAFRIARHALGFGLDHADRGLK